MCCTGVLLGDNLLVGVHSYQCFGGSWAAAWVADIRLTWAPGGGGCGGGGGGGGGGPPGERVAELAAAGTTVPLCTAASPVPSQPERPAYRRARHATWAGTESFRCVALSGAKRSRRHVSDAGRAPPVWPRACSWWGWQPVVAAGAARASAAGAARARPRRGGAQSA